MLWRERLLRSDNITCVTVMLDPPGPPFSDCVLKRKNEQSTYSFSSCISNFNFIVRIIFVHCFSATTSVCSDETVDLDHLSSSTIPRRTSIITTPKKCKPPLERNEHILTPISNGPRLVRVN